MSVSAPLVKAALVDTVLTALFPGVLVTYGEPGSYQPDEIIGVRDQTFEATRPTMGQRSREEAVETVVTFSVFAAGDDGAQRTATERVYAMALALDEHLRVSPNETLGGACRDAWVGVGELLESKAAPSANTSTVAGRVAELSVVVSTLARRT